jgi:integrase
MDKQGKSMTSTTKTKRKTRSDKFPLTLHATGQYCKKIRGKRYYFGKDKKLALQRYLEQATDLHAGRTLKPDPESQDTTLKLLSNAYLDNQETRVVLGEIKPRQVHDQKLILIRFVRYIGTHTRISEIIPPDLQGYLKKLVKESKAPSTINNHVSVIKALFHWAENNQIVSNIPNIKTLKKSPVKKTNKQTFTAEQVKALLSNANPKMKAMIWLGLNCAFGCTDCAELSWKNIDFKDKRVSFPRPKSGIERNLPLWEQTISALQEVSKEGKTVFLTRQGNKYVRVDQKTKPDGTIKTVFHNNITKEFKKIVSKSGIKVEKGVGFYTLRRTAATLAAQSKDPFAVQQLLGHADLKMASIYVQDVAEQTDRVINNTQKLITLNDS